MIVAREVKRMEDKEPEQKIFEDISLELSDRFFIADLLKTEYVRLTLLNDNPPNTADHLEWYRLVQTQEYKIVILTELCLENVVVYEDIRSRLKTKMDSPQVNLFIKAYRSANAALREARKNKCE